MTISQVYSVEKQIFTAKLFVIYQYIRLLADQEKRRSQKYGNKQRRYAI